MFITLLVENPNIEDYLPRSCAHVSTKKLNKPVDYWRYSLLSGEKILMRLERN
jgi:hypothetical protein